MNMSGIEIIELSVRDDDGIGRYDHWWTKRLLVHIFFYLVKSRHPTLRCHHRPMHQPVDSMMTHRLVDQLD